MHHRLSLESCANHLTYFCKSPCYDHHMIRSLILHLQNVSLKTIFFYLFMFWREGKGGRKRGRETSMYGCLLPAPLLGTWPPAQACALTGNGNSDLLVCRMMPSPLNHTSQGRNVILKDYVVDLKL